jgi:endonuclease G, mitochondrial
MNPIFLILLLVVFAFAVYFFNEKMKKENPSKPQNKVEPQTDVETDDPTDEETEPKTDPKSDSKMDNSTKTPTKPTSVPVSNFANRKGYSSSFIKADNFKIRLEDLLKNHLSDLPPLKISTGKIPDLLRYHHFSVAMHRERKMPLLTAVNIDGSETKDLNRESDVWHFDPRLDKQFQLGKEIYNQNDLDLGHLVRRLDPVWGENYLEANDDTFHFTVCAPQHKKLNRVTWLGLEDYILKNTDIEDLKVSVFSGPVFSERDLDYRGIKVPLQFWKMAAVIKKDGTPSVSAYLLSHEAFLGDLERGLIGDDGFGAYKTFQISLEKLQELTNLNLDALLKYDPIPKEHGLTASKPMEIKGFDDIKL